MPKIEKIKCEMIFTTMQKWRVLLRETLHNYGEELQYSYPLSISPFLNAKTLDYLVDNQAFVNFIRLLDIEDKGIIIRI